MKSFIVSEAWQSPSGDSILYMRLFRASATTAALLYYPLRYRHHDDNYLRIDGMCKYFHKYMRNIATIIIVALFALCLWQLSAAGWIQGKAIIAQQLLNSSWAKTRLDSVDSAYKPWPWADTWPVAKLIVPAHDIKQIILAGDSGSSLAFGPGLSLAGVAPNTPGTALISGHRDTHFQFLDDIQLKDLLYIQTARNTERYQVYDLQIVDSKNYKLQSFADEQILVLATCYPFDSVIPGGTLRYLVFANKQPG